MPQNHPLFEKNFSIFKNSNPRLTEGEDYDLDEAVRKRDSSNAQEDLNNWQATIQDSTVKYPNQMVRSHEYAADLKNRYSKFKIGDDILQYYDLPGQDPHLAHLLLDLRQALIETGFDIEDNSRVLEPPHNTLICFGTGDGRALNALLQNLNPFNLYIVVEDNWNDYLSSFWYIDWMKVWEYFSQPPRKVTIIRCKSSIELRSKISSEALLNLEQALTFTPSSSSEKLKEFSREIHDVRTSHVINYLGFTVDELNMVWNSVETLKCRPKIFNPPTTNTDAPFIVCGSGPSLDESIETIRELSNTHLIVASGSNYQTLLANGIEADFLCLNERSLDTYDDFKKTYDLYGRSKTKLVMSSTCPYRLTEIFNETAIFFRPALTPLSVFSDSPYEVLNFEGPEAVNTGVAFAAHVGASKIVLFGVDLGTADKNKLRSKQASGMTPRQFDLEEEGNLSDIAYTSTLLKDVALMINDCIDTFRVVNTGLQCFNCSDGIKLKNFDPISPTEYLKLCQKSVANEVDAKKSVELWWANLPIYTETRLKSSWDARNPRSNTFKLCRELIQLLESDKPWFPTITTELTTILSVDCSLGRQFPRRIMHSTLYKAAVAITQQLYVMSHKDVDYQLFDFGAKAKKIMIDYIKHMENEIYQLCKYAKI